MPSSRKKIGKTIRPIGRWIAVDDWHPSSKGLVAAAAPSRRMIDGVGLVGGSSTHPLPELRFAKLLEEFDLGLLELHHALPLRVEQMIELLMKRRDFELGL